MRTRLIALLTCLALCVVVAARAGRSVDQTVTLYAPGQKYSEDRSWFNFRTGVRGKAGAPARGSRWDLGYGYLSIGGEDFLSVGQGRREDRTVIKDLGALDWHESIEVPTLEPLLALKEGEQRVVTVDSSADKQKEWERTNGIFAKAVVGHIYAVHVMNESADYYALFRVEALEQQQSCTISWRIAQPSEH